MDLTAWSPWSVSELAGRMGATPGWWLSGGMAIEHTIGHGPLRAHGDIDISVLREFLPRVTSELAAHGLLIFGARAGELAPLDDEPARSAVNFWVRDPTCDRWVLQINVESGDAAEWRYRRHPVVRLAWRDAVQDVGGVPTGCLAVQLLFKSKHPTPNDDRDLGAAYSALSRSERAWLTDAIGAAHPDSPWIARFRR